MREGAVTLVYFTLPLIAEWLDLLYFLGGLVRDGAASGALTLVYKSTLAAQGGGPDVGQSVAVASTQKRTSKSAREPPISKNTKILRNKK